ncbi:MAG: thioredoxin family protein [Sulfurovaceae bacterium]|nr:thioredoxin family protein [Sulfurovaceae bacterium]
MKKIIILILLQVVLMAGELTNAMLQAKREGKPLMIMVTSKTCTFCDKMSDITLADPTVKENIQDFMFIKVDQHDAETERFLGRHMEYPPTIFFLSKYKILNKAEGYLSPSDFIPWVEDTKQKLNMNGSTTVTATKTTTTAISTENTSSSINWMHDIPSAVDYAKQTGKQIMIFVGSSKSKWSQELEKKTLVSSKVKEGLSNFVWVKVEKGNASLASYGLNPAHVPTVYFMTAKMRELVASKGFFDANDFLKYINYAKSKI